MRVAVFRLLLTALAAFLVCPAASHAQLGPTPVPATRTALLIGVWNYTDETFPALPEKGIQSDLARMKAKLTELGFQVTVLNNPSLAEAKKAVDSFGAALKTRGGASLFYFTGHGAEHEGKNFLIPAGTNIQVAADLDDEALSANRVLERMEQSGIRVNLVFLDCCRNSLTKSGSDTGLATMSARGALIGFATRSGDVADADENGSPYTNALIKHLGQPGISLPDMHTLVTLELESSGSTRRPGQYVDLGGIFHLVPVRPAPSSPPAQLARATMPAVPPPATPADSILDQGAVGKVIQVKLPGDVLMKFCYCPPGSFVMGSPKGEADRSDYEDQVTVRISKGFWTGQTEVTQGQWKALMAGNPSMFKGDELPVEQVSWEEAQAFVTKLNESVKLPTGWKYALPTEAQWEYACRAGTESVFHFGNTLTSKEANFNGNYAYGVSTQGANLEKTTPVGSYGANAWGLHDMHGNVNEWCLDAWDGKAKLAGGTDPVGTVGSLRAFRSGSWLGRGWGCRSADRGSNDPGGRYYYLGVRVAVVPAER